MTTFFGALRYRGNALAGIASAPISATELDKAPRQHVLLSVAPLKLRGALQLLCCDLFFGFRESLTSTGAGAGVVEVRATRPKPQRPRSLTTKTKKKSRPVSRVLSLDSHSSRPDVAVRLEQPTRERRGPRQMLPYLVLLQVGFAMPRGVGPARGALLPHRFTITTHALRRRSAVCSLLHYSVGSRRPGVTWHPALWSPDFPRSACAPRDCLADSTDIVACQTKIRSPWA